MVRSAVARIWANVIEDNRQKYSNTLERYKEDVKSYLTEDGFKELIENIE
ncbi:hypothetical protein lbkm_3847 [Lachnospiraceae bacterium KM106-2]|nr:hypothetical protein lbkm_3847 [Lachnospiraceae bacterium KM106-2]